MKMTLFKKAAKISAILAAFTSLAIASVDQIYTTIVLKAGEQTLLSTGPTSSVLIQCQGPTQDNDDMPGYPPVIPDAPN